MRLARRVHPSLRSADQFLWSHTHLQLKEMDPAGDAYAQRGLVFATEMPCQRAYGGGIQISGELLKHR